MIPLSVVDLRNAEPYVLEVLRSGVIAQGPMVARLEESFAVLTGVRHAVAMSSGTAALVASMQALDLSPGDEVITSPFTFAATLNAILNAGATARFADIRQEDCCVDPAAVAAAIGPRTRALIPVHLYGQTADMAAIMALTRENGLRVVEDAAQAVGAEFQGRPAGSFDIGCFSLYATKNITTGEGGVVTTDDDHVADRLRLMRNQGMRQDHSYAIVGQNYRLTDLQAALAIPQLAALDELIARRKANAARLTAGLADLTGLRTPTELPGRSHVWHQYTVLVTAEAPVDRDKLAAGLKERGIGHGIYYPHLVFDHACYREHPRVVIGETQTAHHVAKQCLSLPVHPALTDANLDAVIGAVREIFEA